MVTLDCSKSTVIPSCVQYQLPNENNNQQPTQESSEVINLSINNNNNNNNQETEIMASLQPNEVSGETVPPKSAISARNVNIKVKSAQSSIDNELAKRTMKLDLVAAKDLDNFNIASPKSPLSVRITHQTSLTSQVDAGEDRKTLRDALYQGIFHRHRRTIFAVGSFLRMLRTRNSQYNTIRSSSEGEDVDEEKILENEIKENTILKKK